MCDLSQRERQVLQLVWDGLDTKEVAQVLELSPSYIKNVQERLRLKLGASNRVQIVRKAIEQGLIEV